MSDAATGQDEPSRRRPLRSPPHPGRGRAPSAGLENGSGIDAAARDMAHRLAALAPESLHVLIDIGNRCNLRCIMCHFTFDEVFYQTSHLMTPDSFERIAASIRPFTRKLTLSAAYEPTVSPHFEQIIRTAGALRFPEISFLTNGNAMPDRLVEAVVDCGVTEVCFSVHAARADTYAKILRGGRLDRARANIEKLIRIRNDRNARLPRVQFNIALMSSNVAELSEIIGLAAAVGADSVAFRHVIVFEGLGMEAESLAGKNRVDANVKIRAALERARELGVAIYNSPDFFDVPGFRPTSQVSAAGEAAATGSGDAPPVSHPPVTGLNALWKLGRRLLGPGRKAAPDAVPVGSMDSPADGACLGDTLAIDGWALGPTGLTEVYIGRDPTQGDDEADIGQDSLVRIGKATFHNSTRNDVIAAFPGRPLTWRAGWSFKLRGDGLPDGDHVIKAVAIDRDGSKAVIGIRTIRKARRAEGSIPPLRCHKPFDSLYIDARGNVYPYPDCHTDQPFGEHKGQPFEAIWSHARLIELREQMVAGCAPEMCRRCPLFINQEVDVPETFAAHGDFSTEDRR